MNSKISRFERNQAYIRGWKSDHLRGLAFKFRNELLDLETPAETIFKSYLIGLKVKYEFQKVIFAGSSFYIVDFFIPKYNLVVEIDGYHHSNDDKLVADEKRTEDLKKVGVKRVIRFKNSEVFDKSKCLSKIRSTIKNERILKKSTKK